MEKIEGELFIPEGELFIPRLTVVWTSVARPDSQLRNGKFDRGMESLTEEWKVSLRFFSFQDHSLFSPTDAFFLSVGLRQTIRLVVIPDATYGCPLI